MTPQMLKRLKNKLKRFEESVEDKCFLGMYPAEYHEEMIQKYENAKQDLIDLVESFTKE